VPEELPPQDEPEVGRVPDSDQPDVDDEGHQDPTTGNEPDADADRATDELEALSIRFLEAVRDRDLAWLEEHLAPEFTLTTGRPGAPVRGRAEWLAVTAERYVIEDFCFEELEVIELADAAVVRSRYRQRGSLDGADRSQTFLMTDVWARRGGLHQLVTRHVSPLPDA